jgi:hypothetical protein
MIIGLLSVVLNQQKNAIALWTAMGAYWITSPKGDFLD